MSTRATHVRDVTALPDRVPAEQLREALSLLPTAVGDELREELSPYPTGEFSDSERSFTVRKGR